MERRSFLKSAAATAAFSLSATALPGRASTQPPSMGPLLDPWTGPHGGLPRFDLVRKEDFKPALLKGIELAREDIRRITTQDSAATFANTIEAFEDMGRELGRASNFFYVFTSNLNDKEMQKIEAEMAPLLSAFNDEVIQNDALFRRIKTVYDHRTSEGLTAEQIRLVETHYDRFARRGAALGAVDKARLKDINGELATLYTRFGQNQLHDEETYTLVIDDEADLAGLPLPMRDAAAQAAAERNLQGKWVFTNTRSSMEPFLTYAERRELREKGWRMWVNRGDNPGEHNNRKVASQILKLRAERAKLLGFPTHAHWMLDNNMAKTPDNAMNLMSKVWKAAVARAKEEVADMQAIADSEGANITIEPWDYRYYAEKVRKVRYNVDQNEVKEYLQLDRIFEGMLWATKQVFGLDFARLSGIPVFHPDMSVWEVRRDGEPIGLFYFDPFARPGKNSGAWMTDYRAQERFRADTRPIVSNNCNYIKAKPGEPVLISWDDASTLFHEFGHALHGLLSNVSYPTLSGTNVKRDFVEFPSQVMEYWFPTKEVLGKYAVHYQTGEPIPQSLVDKVLEAQNFNQGFATTEYLASAIYDMKIHLAATTDQDIDPVEFEQRVRQEIGCPREIVLRHRPTAFGHIFSGDAYSAGYYVYMWADTMTADVHEGFMEKGGLYNPETCKLLETAIMSVGNSIPPDEAFRRFRGRDVDTNALMRDRDFPVT
ncbi:MAG: M3 family metallopeptidase [Steroidobacteraceae bacterium]